MCRLWSSVKSESKCSHFDPHSFSAVLTNLNIQFNKLGPERGAAIAKALEVNRVLKRLYVAMNDGLGQGKRALRDACAGPYHPRVWLDV